MAKIDEEEFQEIEANDRYDQIISALKDLARSARNSQDKPDDAIRHNEIVAVLKAISDRPAPQDVSTVLSDLVDKLTGIETKRMDDIKQIVQEIKDGIASIQSPEPPAKPKAFTIERNDLGFIKRVVPEY